MAKVAVSKGAEALAGALLVRDNSFVFWVTSVRGSEVDISGVALDSVGLLFFPPLNKRRITDIASGLMKYLLC